MKGLFSEDNAVKVAVAPATMMGSAITSEKVSLSKSFGMAIVLNFGASTGSTVNVNLKQEDSVGTIKDLAVKHPYFVKAGAETVFTKNEATGLALVDLNAKLADEAGIAVIEIASEDLDTNNGFANVFIELDDAVSAKLVSAEFILHEPRFRPAYKETV